MVGCGLAWCLIGRSANVARRVRSGLQNMHGVTDAVRSQMRGRWCNVKAMQVEVQGRLKHVPHSSMAIFLGAFSPIKNVGWMAPDQYVTFAPIDLLEVSFHVLH
jgi:hypothetical protein